MNLKNDSINLVYWRICFRALIAAFLGQHNPASTHARLALLSYSRNRMQQDVRIRLLGGWRNPEVAAYGATHAVAIDVEQLGKAIEFTIPTFSTIAIVDLTR